jgi:hypothetical protein
MRRAREPAEGSVDLASRIADTQAEGCRGSMDLIPTVMSGARGNIPGAGRFGLTAAVEKHLVILAASGGFVSAGYTKNLMRFSRRHASDPFIDEP